MSKNIITGNEARLKLLEGIELVAKPVLSTMGPSGRSVLIQQGYGNPISTNDGVTVARSIDLSDNALEQGANLLKLSASNTNKLAGDGTTTTTALTYAIIQEGLGMISSGLNPFSLAKNLNIILDILKKELEKKSIPVSTGIKDIATISAQDEGIGGLIAEIIEELGHQGLISVEQGQTLGLSKDVVQGMQIDQGYLSHYFVNDHNKQESVMTNTAVIVTDKVISNFAEIAPLLEKIMVSGKKSVTIFAEDIIGNALNSLIANAVQGKLQICCVKLPGYQQWKEARMIDIATVTGSKIISQSLGLSFENADIEKTIGFSEKIVVSKDKTLIIGGAGTKEEIAQRVDVLNNQLKDEKSEYSRKLARDQIAKMSGGVAIIRIGAPTEVETINRKHKIEDAINATKSAIEEGVVAGGGYTFVELSQNLTYREGDVEYNIAVDIIKKALEFPTIQIANNAGHKGDWVVEESKRLKKGYNARLNIFGDMMKMKIIDPAKVLRVALENAISTAITVLTTDCLVLNEKTKGSE